MSTITPSRLKEVLNAAEFRALTDDNFVILAEEIAKRVATYVSGSPTTTVGPPTTGAHVLNEFWRDALGGEWRCTSAGSPGTWIQILPAHVTADPSTGTIPTGYRIFNTTSNQLKIHQGSYEWHSSILVAIQWDVSRNETTAITTGTNKLKFRMPFSMHVQEVRFSVSTAPLGLPAIFDVNEAGTSIFSTRPQIDTGQTTTVGSGTPAVISDSELADNAQMSVDFDQVGSGTAGAGVKMTFLGYRT